MKTNKLNADVAQLGKMGSRSEKLPSPRSSQDLATIVVKDDTGYLVQQAYSRLEPDHTEAATFKAETVLAV